jgi:predicted nuclease of predicted toxin-antitoxin system
VNLLDENFPEEQAARLRSMGVKVRHFGHDWGDSGTDDTDIIPILHRQRGVTFFTADSDFCKAWLCHPAYALVMLNVGLDDFANMTRRFLRHPQFDTIVKRMGVVAEIRHQRILVWRRGVRTRTSIEWRD